MTGALHVGDPEIKPHEIARRVLIDSGQAAREAVNPAQILEHLELSHLSVDFAREFPAEIRHRMSPAHPRAMLSAADRLIATDAALSDTDTRFAVLHEIAHYLLPHHMHALYVCDDAGMSARTRLILEQEANSLAYDLLFQGDRFSIEANGLPPTAASVRTLAQKYRASLEATARRIAEKRIGPCMMVLFGQGDGPGTKSVDPDAPPSWTVRYCVPSPTFAMHHFRSIGGSAPPSLAARATALKAGRSGSSAEELDLGPIAGDRTHQRFRCEIIRAADDLIALITPAGARRHRSAESQQPS